MSRAAPKFRVLSIALLLAPAAACAGHTEPTPAWFTQRAAALDAQGTPDLKNIPHGTDATIDPAHWAKVQSEMRAAEAELRANPRSAPLPPGGAAQDQAAFDAQAQHDLDATRSHY